MKRYILILAILVIASGLLVACGQEGKHTEDDVRFSFLDTAKKQTLPDRMDIFRVWSNQIILSKVKYLKEKDVYEIQLPDIKLAGVEVWTVDMKSSRISPQNSVALLMAVALFCQDDKEGDCQSYFRQLDALKRKISTGRPAQ